MQTLFPKLENGLYMTPYGKKAMKPRNQVYISVTQLCHISGMARRTILNKIYSGDLEPDMIEPGANYKFNVDTAKAYVLKTWKKGRCSMYDPNDELGYDNREIYFATKEFFN